MEGTMIVAGVSATTRALSAALALLLGGCCRVGADEPVDEAAEMPARDADAGASAAPSPAPIASQGPPAAGQDAGAPPMREIAGAAHVLVAYKGAELAPPAVAPTRTRAAAQARAGEAHRLLVTKRATFEEIVKKYSDDPISRSVDGAIGNFERSAMPEAFSTATFNLAVGATSDVVETPRGFHIIRRTK
jgi:peptidyl-prolyl cis-trans isomerase NIMA-interacting 1